MLLGSTAERVIRKGDASVLVVASRPTAPYERPLLAVDCSEHSRRAVEIAGRVATASPDVVFAYEPVPESTLRRTSIMGGAVEQYHQAAKGQAEAAVEAFLGAGDGVTPASITVREGDARQMILDVAAERRADLLVLGTHGRSGVAQVLLAALPKG
jgi:nucleotide-binding universal stress UspA family protein